MDEQNKPIHSIRELADEINLPEKHELSANSAHKKMTTKKMVFYGLLGLLGVMLLTVLILGVRYMMKGDKNDNNTDNNTNDQDDDSDDEDDQNAETTPTPGATQTPKQIAYTTEGNVWIISEDAKTKKQITKDAGDNINYGNIQWQEDKKLYYTKADKNAKKADIIAYDMTTAKAKVVSTIQNITWLDILEYSPDFSSYVYLYTAENNDVVLEMSKGTTKKELLRYDERLGRGGDFDDEVDIEFAPDGNNFLFSYTLIQDASESFLTIFDKDGKEVKSFKDAATDVRQTFGLFIDNTTVYYKKITSSETSTKSELRKLNIKTLSDQLVKDSFNGYNLEISPDRKNIAFWEHAEGKSPSLSTFEISTNKATLVDSDLSIPAWFDNDTLLTLETEASTDGMFGFEFTNLSIIDKNGKNFRTLVNEVTHEFAASK